ncbi:MAG: two-component regulator propeller domain-containing protein [Bryobacteraceae bacterium]
MPKSITSFGWGVAQITFQDHLGEWWVPTADGLVRFPVSRFEQLGRARPKAIYKMIDGLPGNPILRTFEDSRGNIWVGTNDGNGGVNGGALWDRATETFHRFELVPGMIPMPSPKIARADSGSDSTLTDLPATKMDASPSSADPTESRLE